MEAFLLIAGGVALYLFLFGLSGPAMKPRKRGDARLRRTAQARKPGR